MRSILLLFVACFGFISSITPASAAEKNRGITKAPSLIVLVVFDQLRGDYLTRFQSKFLPPQGQARAGQSRGGFRWMMENSAYYPIAEYRLSSSMTCPGHATMLTGAWPYQTGIPLNHWYDPALGRSRHCVEDPEHALLPATEDNRGASPRQLIGTTVGDELKNAYPSSRVVSIALKDRSAILPGGYRADIALWFEESLFSFVSSRFYFRDGKLPPWVGALNTQVAPKKGAKLNTEAGYELTLQAVERAFDAYQLGQGTTPDLLAVSFSSLDMAGHVYGPYSPEIERMVIGADRALSKLLSLIDRKSRGGLSQTVVAIASDHGVAPDSGWLQKHRVEAGRIDSSALTAELNTHLNEKFGSVSDSPWVPFTLAFHYFLNPKNLAEKKLEPSVVEAEAKAWLMRRPEFASVTTRSEISSGKVPHGVSGPHLLNTSYPGRTGDIIALPKPYWLPGPGTGANHLTGYTYDRQVPLLISGPKIRSGLYPRHVEMVDLAPTLSFIVGLLPPPLSEGHVLHEAVQGP